MLKGRSRARQESIIILAHQIEAMARQKKLKPVADYLGRRRRRRGTDEGIIPMIETMRAKGLVTVSEIPKGDANGG